MARPSGAPAAPLPAVVLLLLPALATALANDLATASARSRASASCPAGPFKLHGFAPNRSVDNETARPYFIVVCGLSTTVRLDPLMHPDGPQCHSHMHSVFGSGRFGPTVSLGDSVLGRDELANTTCNIPADGSMYAEPRQRAANCAHVSTAATTTTTPPRCLPRDRVLI